MGQVRPKVGKMRTKAGVVVLEAEKMDYEEWFREWAMKQATPVLKRLQRTTEMELAFRELREEGVRG